MVTEVENHILSKFEIEKRLGKGAYGIVWKVVDKETKKVFALKKIFDAFRNTTDSQRTFREIMFLREFGCHENIIKLYQVLRANNDKDIYLVFEFIETDLHNVISKGNVLQPMHIGFVTYQLMKALKFLHSGKVIHRDLKPSNVLLNSQCLIKVCDFGLARSLKQLPSNDNGDPLLTQYIATRWYRAPEILLNAQRYTTGIDQWSAGCILGEMLLGKALFPGTSTFNQLECVMAAIDPPSNKDVVSMQSHYGATLVKQKLSRKPLSETFKEADKEAVKLLKELLVFNPDKRISAQKALEHSYVSMFRTPDKEVDIGRDVLPMISDAETLTLEEYRTKLYELIELNELVLNWQEAGQKKEAQKNKDNINESSDPIDLGTYRASDDGNRVDGGNGGGDDDGGGDDNDTKNETETIRKAENTPNQCLTNNNNNNINNENKNDIINNNNNGKNIINSNNNKNNNRKNQSKDVVMEGVRESFEEKMNLSQRNSNNNNNKLSKKKMVVKKIENTKNTKISNKDSITGKSNNNLNNNKNNNFIRNNANNNSIKTKKKLIKMGSFNNKVYIANDPSHNDKNDNNKNNNCKDKRIKSASYLTYNTNKSAILRKNLISNNIKNVNNLNDFKRSFSKRSFTASRFLFSVPSKEPQDAEKADKLQSAKMTSKTNKRIDNDHTKRSQITKGFNKQKTEAKTRLSSAPLQDNVRVRTASRVRSSQPSRDLKEAQLSRGTASKVRECWTVDISNVKKDRWI